MSCLVVRCGGQAITCMGLAGTGDLVATCTSEHSRNRRFGKLLAEGGTLEEFAAQTHMVAEGALACKTLKTLADCYDVELPITDVVRSIAWEGADPHDVAKTLTSRPLTTEFYGLSALNPHRGNKALTGGSPNARAYCRTAAARVL